MIFRWLHLRLTAPLIAFGGVAIDQVGPTRDFPSTSGLVGLLANALGFDRTDWQAHQELQDRLVFAAVISRQGRVLTDVQNAKLEKADKGWSWSGKPEGRSGATYDSPHRRSRDFLADHELHVVLRLAGVGTPTLDDLIAALDRPARPLFIGRKPCLPAAPILAGEVTAETPHSALLALGVFGQGLWPGTTAKESGTRLQDVADLRNWRTGLHGGSRTVVLGAVQ